MTKRISDLLDLAARRALPVVDGVPDDKFGAPTPCSEYTVADLANHLYQVVVNFQKLAKKEDVDWSAVPDFLHGDWRQAFAGETEALIAAWAAPDAEEGVSAGMGLPNRVVGQMVLLDLTFHPWDLAQATGQAFEPDPEVLPELADLVATMGPNARKMGVFGEPVAVPDDADAFVRILGATGRDPHWKPGA
ncbi:TIGR03086 family metal-binding protein [Yinghuangia soli]|uniref:TIGR03086 family metal-binding protein n=1 Tax=Yinghuangia soli TaxID=2908204 RepID=A0AA41PYK6_9ACTN|nr:TIGR03086 family metal-binding protein [Yinghuangia soli]MCF2527750.1 TIGR03086 family metal-binding protein [Yinghuangia soli]